MVREVRLTRGECDRLARMDKRGFVDTCVARARLEGIPARGLVIVTDLNGGVGLQQLRKG